MGPGKVHFGENLLRILCGLGHPVVEAKGSQERMESLGRNLVVLQGIYEKN